MQLLPFAIHHKYLVYSCTLQSHYSFIMQLATRTLGEETALPSKLSLHFPLSLSLSLSLSSNTLARITAASGQNWYKWLKERTKSNRTMGTTRTHIHSLNFSFLIADAVTHRVSCRQHLTQLQLFPFHRTNHVAQLT